MYPEAPLRKDCTPKLRFGRIVPRSSASEGLYPEAPLRRDCTPKLRFGRIVPRSSASEGLYPEAPLRKDCTPKLRFGGIVPRSSASEEIKNYHFHDRSGASGYISKMLPKPPILSSQPYIYKNLHLF
jgi:hypothetical protein